MEYKELSILLKKIKPEHSEVDDRELATRFLKANPQMEYGVSFDGEDSRKMEYKDFATLLKKIKPGLADVDDKEVVLRFLKANPQFESGVSVDSYTPPEITPSKLYETEDISTPTPVIGAPTTYSGDQPEGSFIGTQSPYGAAQAKSRMIQVKEDIAARESSQPAPVRPISAEYVEAGQASVLPKALRERYKETAISEEPILNPEDVEKKAKEVQEYKAAIAREGEGKAEAVRGYKADIAKEAAKDFSFQDFVGGISDIRNSSAEFVSNVFKWCGDRDVESTKRLLANAPPEERNKQIELAEKRRDDLYSFFQSLKTEEAPEDIEKNQKISQLVQDVGEDPKLLLKAPEAYLKAVTNLASRSAVQTLAAVTKAGNPLMMITEGGSFAEEAKRLGIEDSGVILLGQTINGVVNGTIETYSDRLVVSPLKAIGKSAEFINNAKKRLTKKISNKILAPVLSSLSGGVTEFSEEELQNKSSQILMGYVAARQIQAWREQGGQEEKIKKLEENLKEYLKDDQALQRKIVSAFSGMFMGGGASVARLAVDRVSTPKAEATSIQPAAPVVDVPSASQEDIAKNLGVDFIGVQKTGTGKGDFDLYNVDIGKEGKTTIAVPSGSAEDIVAERVNNKLEQAKTTFEGESAQKEADDAISELEQLLTEKKPAAETQPEGAVLPKDIKDLSPEDSALAEEGLKRLTAEEKPVAVEKEYSEERESQILNNVSSKSKVEIPEEQKDKLSGLFNKNITKPELKKFAEESNKTNSQVGTYAFYFDIDNFKSLNEQYGHQYGDIMIQRLGELTSEFFSDKKRGTEGGEEFAVWGLDASDAQRAADFIKYVGKNLTTLDDQPVTVSGGFGKGTTLTEKGDSRVLAEKVAALAKQSGRNQIVLDIGGKTDYIKGIGIGEKEYVTRQDIRNIPEEVERLTKSKFWNTLAPEDRRAFERTVEILRNEGGKRGVSLQGEVNNDTAPASGNDEVSIAKETSLPTTAASEPKTEIPETERPKTIAALKKLTDIESLKSYPKYQILDDKLRDYNKLKIKPTSSLYDLVSKKEVQETPKLKRLLSKDGKTLDEIASERGVDAQWLIDDILRTPTKAELENMLIDDYVEMMSEAEYMKRQDEITASQLPETDTGIDDYDSQSLDEDVTDEGSPDEDDIVPFSIKKPESGVATEEDIRGFIEKAKTAIPEDSDIEFIVSDQYTDSFGDNKKFERGQLGTIIYNKEDGSAKIYINKNTPKKYVYDVVSEEIAHYGIDKFGTTEEESKLLKRLYSYDKNSSVVKDIQQNYGGFSESQKYNEWIAKHLKNYNTKTGTAQELSIAKKVYEYLKRIVRKILGRLGVTSTQQEIDSVISKIAERVKRGESANIKKDVSQKFSQRKEKPSTVERQTEVRGEEQEVRSKRGLSFSMTKKPGLAERRKELENEIMTLRQESAQKIREMIIDYAKEAGAKEDVRLMVAKTVAKVTTLAGFIKYTRRLDSMLTDQKTKKAKEVLSRYIKAQQKRIKNLTGKQKPSVPYEYEYNKNTQEYLKGLLLSGAEKQKFASMSIEDIESQNEYFVYGAMLPNIDMMTLEEATEAIGYFSSLREMAKKNYEAKQRRDDISLAVKNEAIKNKNKASRIKQFKDKLKAIKRFAFPHLSAVQLIDILTLNKNDLDVASALKTNVLYPVPKAHTKEYKLKEKFSKAFDEIHSGVDIDDMDATIMEIEFSPGKKEEIALRKALAFYAFSKNDRGLELLEYYVLDKMGVDRNNSSEMEKNSPKAMKSIQEIVKNIPEKYKKMVDKQIEYNDTVMYDILNEQYKKERGIDLPKETFYFRIMGLYTKEDQNLSPIEILTGKAPGFGMNKGMIKKRKGGYALFRDIDYVNNVLRTQADVAHYVAFSDAISDMRAALSDPQTQSALNAIDEVAFAELNSWIKDVERNNYDAVTPMDFVANLGSVAGVGYIRLNPTTVLTQLAAVFPTLRDVSKKDMMAGLAAYAKMSREGSLKEFIYGKTSVLEARANKISPALYTKNVMDAFNKILPGESGKTKRMTTTLSEMTLWAMKFADEKIAMQVWLTKYLQGLRLGRTENEAISMADEVIYKTQNMGDPIYLPRVLRTKGLSKAFYMYLQQPLQYFGELIKQISVSLKTKDRSEILSTIMFYSLIPGAFMALIRAGMNPFKLADEPEEIVKEAAGQVSGIPVVGEAVQYGIKLMGNLIREKQFKEARSLTYDSKLSPVFISVFEDFLKSGGRVFTEKDLASALDFVGQTSAFKGVPYPMIKRAVQSYEEGSPKRFLVGAAASKDLTTEKNIFETISKKETTKEFKKFQSEMREKYGAKYVVDMSDKETEKYENLLGEKTARAIKELNSPASRKKFKDWIKKTGKTEEELLKFEINYSKLGGDRTLWE